MSQSAGMAGNTENEIRKTESRFQLVSEFSPQGDQPLAVEKLVRGLQQGFKDQVLLGVTGSGKTFTMAKVIEQIQKPTLVIAPNKTLAAQLCSEFKVFPHNAVEFLSATMIITSLKHIFPSQTPILKRILP